MKICAKRILDETLKKCDCVFTDDWKPKKYVLEAMEIYAIEFNKNIRENLSMAEGLIEDNLLSFKNRNIDINQLLPDIRNKLTPMKNLIAILEKMDLNNNKDPLLILFQTEIEQCKKNIEYLSGNLA